MLSCFLNDAAAGCLHWPKCANNFYDYNCNKGIKLQSASASPSWPHASSFWTHDACAGHMHTSMIGRQAAADPPVMYDTMLCDTSVKISVYVCLACFLHVVVGNFLLAGAFWGRNQITIIVAKLVNICAPKRSNKSLLFSFNTFLCILCFIFAVTVRKKNYDIFY